MGAHRDMNVQLSPSHEKWLIQQVTSGVFPSVEAAVAWAIERMKPVADDDLEWARRLLEAGKASLAQGDGIEGDAFLAVLARRIEALR
jgi:Arc/MetJ-type ribon-helix-helix transcriptional regulator